MPWPLHPQGKNPWYPLDRRLGGPQSQSGGSGEEKNLNPASHNLTLMEKKITSVKNCSGKYLDLRRMK
jgi:hypothetical protein